VLESRGLGGAASWGFVGDAPEPADGAKAWLDQQFGSEQADADKALETLAPKAPVAVGASWDVDLSSLVDEALKKLPVDKTKAKGAARLVAVEAGVAHVQVKIELPLASVPGTPGTSVPWTKGGTLAMTMDLRVGIDEAPRIRSATLRGGLEGEAKVESPEGTLSLSLAIEIGEETRFEQGGEVPGPPPPAGGPPESPK
jgi:hypothetical protein